MEFFLRTLSHAVGVSLVCAALIVLLWAGFFIVSINNNKINMPKAIYIPYLSYTCFIFMWILSNAYFQCDHITYYSKYLAIDMAIFADVVCFFAFVSAYVFSCKLISKDKKLSLRSYQKTILFVSSVVTMLLIFSPYLAIIQDVLVEGPGSFTIVFSRYNIIFFYILLILLVLTFINFYVYRSYNYILMQKKAGYMILGVIIFMSSTAVSTFIVPIFFQDFFLVWIPPLLSVIESLLVGYGLLFIRFYTPKYIIFISLSFIANVLLYISPILLVYAYLGLSSALVCVSVVCIICSGIFWEKTFKCIKSLMSKIFYGFSGDPVENINNLVDVFRKSSEQAIFRLNSILNVTDGSIQKVGEDDSSRAYKSYFKSYKALLKDEVDYIIHHNVSGDINTIIDVNKNLNESGSALVLPIFSVDNQVSHIFTVSRKDSGILFSGEEVLALQRLLERIKQYIYTEERVNKSKILAGSIAHEIRNPLSKIKYHFEKINQDAFKAISASAGQSSSLDNQNIFKEVSGGQNAVNLGTKFIDIILNEIQDKDIRKDNFTYLSVRSILLNAINDFSFQDACQRRRVNLISDNDFKFWGCETLFSFVLYNLLKNATYYFDSYRESVVNIDILLGKEKNYIIFKDTGPGINQKNISYIFEEFFSEGKASGNGLGLPYCKRVMKSFDGDISCESIEGSYTSFTLSFPNIIDKNLYQDIFNDVREDMKNKQGLFIGKKENIKNYLSILFKLGVTIQCVSDFSSAETLLALKYYDFIFVGKKIDHLDKLVLQDIRRLDKFYKNKNTPFIKIDNRFEVNREFDDTIFQGYIDPSLDDYSFYLAIGRLNDQCKLRPVADYSAVKALVVDDIKVNRLLVVSYLKQFGIFTREASNGSSAVDMVLNEQFDLVFMDIQMPVMDGFEATNKIRVYRKNLPIIAVSGEDSEEMLKTIKIYMDDHIVKPINKEVLNKKLYFWLSKNSR